jgi:hypothetical protein
MNSLQYTRIILFDETVHRGGTKGGGGELELPSIT